MKLTSENVHKTLSSCFFKDNEDQTGAIIVEGIMSKFGFHPERLAQNKQNIGEMLTDLGDSFHEDKGGGMSFLNACMTKDGEHWGEHSSMEALFVLGVATNQAKSVLPRNMWNLLPGGMPYFVVKVGGF